jgi:hypothetical protein
MAALWLRVKLGVLAGGGFGRCAFGGNFVARSCARSNMALKADWPDTAQFIVEFPSGQPLSSTLGRELTAST